MEGKIRIGELAKSSNISKQTLIYYDKIGLLKPSYSEDNKYRYYTYDDTDKLALILMLKDSGLELKSIKKYLASPSHELGINLLVQQRDVLEVKMHQIKKTIRFLDKRIDYMSYYENLDIYEGIKIIDKPERYIYKVELNHTLENPFDTAIKELKELLDSHPKLFGVVYSKFSFYKSLNTVFDENPIYLSIFDFITEKIEDSHFIILPGRRYICYHHKGPYYTSSKSYSKMFEYMKKNNFQSDGDVIEVPLIDVWAAKSEKDYITEFQIPVVSINI